MLLFSQSVSWLVDPHQRSEGLDAYDDFRHDQMPSQQVSSFEAWDDFFTILLIHLTFRFPTTILRLLHPLHLTKMSLLFILVESKVKEEQC
jgi:hypothetical protein